MTISDYIRDGCKILPNQTRRQGLMIDSGGTPIGGCVRSAAHAAYAHRADASLWINNEGVCEELYDAGHPLNVALSSIKVSRAEAPDCLVEKVPEFPASLMHAITELNDHAEWTRERIAAWISHNGDLDMTIEEATHSMASMEA